MRLAQMVIAAPVLSCRFGPQNINWKAWQRLAVYPDLGIVYNRIKKNANTTAVSLLREIESGEVETEIDGRKDVRKIDASLSTAASLTSSLFFVIVRNPYSRVLSAFLDKFREDEYRQQFGAFELTPDGFAQFVDWLAAGGLDKNGHWDIQSNQLFLPLEKFDVVVRFENLKDEITTLLAGKGLEVPPGRLDAPYPADVKKKTSADSLLERFYVPRVKGMVGELYKSDFEALRYAS